MTDLLVVKVGQRREQLVHDLGSLALGQMLTLKNEVEEFATFAVLENKEADIVPFPDFVQLDYIWMIQNFQNVDLVDKGRVIFDLLLLDGFDGEFLMTLPVLCQVNNAETSVCQLLLEGVNFFNVTLR